MTSEEEDQCGSPQSMSTNVAIPESSGITAPVCDDSNFNGGSAIAQTGMFSCADMLCSVCLLIRIWCVTGFLPNLLENKVSMTAEQEKFLQELEKLVKVVKYAFYSQPIILRAL